MSSNEAATRWTLAAGRGSDIHLFTQADEDGRAVCNTGHRPRQFTDGVTFRTAFEWSCLPEYETDLTFCPDCDRYDLGV